MWIYQDPELPPTHLRGVELHEYTDTFTRQRNPSTGRCGAMPARAFRLEYPKGCRRERNHEAGVHSAVVKTAQSLDRKARLRGWRPA